MASRRSRDEDFGLKKSSGVNYAQVADRHVDDERFERQRAVRAAAAAPPVEKRKEAPSAAVAAPQSATMDAFMRMLTGKEERTIADRISDPNRPTWEQYKKDNADKLDLNDKGEKEMREYRRKLDAEREKRLSRAGGGDKKKKKRKKHSRSESSSEDSESDDDRRRSRKRSRKSKKRHKRRHSSSDASEDSESDSDARSRAKKRKSKKSRKASSSKTSGRDKRGKDKDKDRSASASPVRLSSFFQQQHASDSDA